MSTTTNSNAAEVPASQPIASLNHLSSASTPLSFKRRRAIYWQNPFAKRPARSEKAKYRYILPM